MKIWLIRHTSVAVGPAFCYGRTDVELAASFPDEASLVKAKLGPISPAAPVICSPAQRCRRLAESLGPEVSAEPALWEMNFGAWEMLRWDEVPRDQMDAWAIDLVGSPPPGGESLQAVAERAHEAWERLTALNAETVYCVTHAGIIRVLLATLFEMPLSKAFSLQVDYGGCSLVESANKLLKLRKFNL